MNEEKNLQIEELEQVSGGGGDENGMAYCYCPNPKCPNHNMKYHAYPENCLKCGAEMVWVDP